MAQTFCTSNSNDMSVTIESMFFCYRLWNRPAQSTPAITALVALSIGRVTTYPHAVKNHIYEDPKQHWPVPAEVLTGPPCLATTKTDWTRISGTMAFRSQTMGYRDREREWQEQWWRKGWADWMIQLLNYRRVLSVRNWICNEGRNQCSFTCRTGRSSWSVDIKDLMFLKPACWW